jgi:hypothetical protein
VNQQDYIMRMIDQLAVFLGRIMFHKAAGNLVEAGNELEATVTNMLGLDPELFFSLPPEALSVLIDTSAAPGPDTWYVAGVLLAEQADLLERAAAPSIAAPGAGAEDRRIHGRKTGAVSMLLKACQAGADQARVHARIDALVASIEFEAADRGLLRSLLLHYEADSLYGKAEDFLFILAALAGEEAHGFCLSFYDRLLLKEDGELARGGLPRTEILEGLQTLKGLWICGICPAIPGSKGD